MKQALLVALVCINAVLLVALVADSGAPAKAQVIGGGANYLVITAEAASNYDILYVLDLASRQLAAWKFDKQRNELQYITKRQLERDFGRGKRPKF